MGRIVVTEFMSLDGVVEAPGGEPGYAHAGWVMRFFSDDFGPYKGAEIFEAQALLLGRVTYDSFAGAWPDRAGDPGADKFNAMPKYVVSRTMDVAHWHNSTVLKGDLATHVAELKDAYDGVIQVPGSISLVAALRELDLVDEYHLQVFPVVLGSGRRLFAETPDFQDLSLKSAQTYSSGVVALEYTR